MPRNKSHFIRVLGRSVEEARQKVLGRQPNVRITTIRLMPAAPDNPQDLPPFMYYVKYREA